MHLRVIRSWHVHQQVQERLRPSWYQSSTILPVPENLVSVQLLLVPPGNWPARHTGYTHYDSSFNICYLMCLITLTAVTKLLRIMLHAAWEIDALVNTRVFDTFNLLCTFVLTVFAMQCAWLFMGKSLVLLFSWHTKKCTYVSK